MWINYVSTILYRFPKTGRTVCVRHPVIRIIGMHIAVCTGGKVEVE